MNNLIQQEPWELRGQNEARIRALETTVALIDTGVWSTYVPTLTAATTDPTLGTGSTATGRYTQIGRTVIGNLFIEFGTASVSAGSGEYYVGLPVAHYSDGRHQVMGNGWGYDSSVNLLEQFVFTIQQSGLVVMFKNGAYAVTDASPWTWAASDHIALQFTYEADA